MLGSPSLVRPVVLGVERVNPQDTGPVRGLLPRGELPPIRHRVEPVNLEDGMGVVEQFLGLNNAVGRDR